MDDKTQLRQPPGLPFSTFSSREEDQRHAFQRWRESVEVVFDVSPSDKDDAIEFYAAVDAFFLNTLVLGRVEFQSQRFVRAKSRASKDGTDHYLVQLYVSGGYIGCIDDRQLTVSPGDISILDLAKPVETLATRSKTISLVIPRSLIDEVVPHVRSLHGMVIQGGSSRGQMVGSYLSHLLTVAADLELSEGASLSDVTVRLLGACLEPTAKTLEGARDLSLHVTLARLKAYIEARLASPDLNVDKICAAHSLSRAHLYRFFVPFGGVSHYIQERRLNLAFAKLSGSSARHIRIGTLAYDLGFSSESQFSRCFRRTFGAAPRDVRHAAMAGDVAYPGPLVSDPRLPEFANWIRKLSAST